MDVRGKEPETRVLERELTARLCDAALAQNQHLPAFAQCLADDCPFLEGVLEHVSLRQLVLVNFRLTVGWFGKPRRAGDCQSVLQNLSVHVDCYGPKSLSLVGWRRIKSCTAARGSLSSCSMR